VSIADDMARRLAVLPDRWDAIDWQDAIRLDAAERRLFDEIADNDEVLRHAYLTVHEDSTAAEKERYRTALMLSMEQFEAAALLFNWNRSSGRDSAVKGVAKVRRKQRRKMSRMRKIIEQIGDPTAPGWQRTRWARVTHWAAAHGFRPTHKPARRTVYVQLQDSEVWLPARAVVEQNGTAVLPRTGMRVEWWRFPPGSRVRCEWRERNGRPQLHAVSLDE